MIEYWRAPSRVGETAPRACAEVGCAAVGSTETTDRMGNTRSVPSNSVLSGCRCPSLCVTDCERSLLSGRAPVSIEAGHGVDALSDRFRAVPGLEFVGLCDDICSVVCPMSRTRLTSQRLPEGGWRRREERLRAERTRRRWDGWLIEIGGVVRHVGLTVSQGKSSVACLTGSKARLFLFVF